MYTSPIPEASKNKEQRTREFLTVLPFAKFDPVHVGPGPGAVRTLSFHYAHKTCAHIHAETTSFHRSVEHKYGEKILGGGV